MCKKIGDRTNFIHEMTQKIRAVPHHNQSAKNDRFLSAYGLFSAVRALKDFLYRFRGKRTTEIRSTCLAFIEHKINEIKLNRGWILVPILNNS